MEGKAKAKALRELVKVINTLAHVTGVKLDLSVEGDDDGDDVLVVNQATMVAWMDDLGNYVVDETCVTSDPSVGIFGEWEARSWGPGREPLLITNSDLDAAAKLITETVRISLEWAVEAEAEAREYREHESVS